MALLTPEELSDAMVGLDGWTVVDGQLEKELTCPDFRAAVAWVVRAAFEAEAANHHPDIDIRYRRVRLRLSTHSEGGLTAKDIELARALDGLATG